MRHGASKLESSSLNILINVSIYLLQYTASYRPKDHSGFLFYSISVQSFPTIKKNLFPAKKWLILNILNIQLYYQQTPEITGDVSQVRKHLCLTSDCFILIMQNPKVHQSPISSSSSLEGGLWIKIKSFYWSWHQFQCVDFNEDSNT